MHKIKKNLYLYIKISITVGQTNQRSYNQVNGITTTEMSFIYEYSDFWSEGMKVMSWMLLVVSFNLVAMIDLFLLMID